MRNAQKRAKQAPKGMYTAGLGQQWANSHPTPLPTQPSEEGVGEFVVVEDDDVDALGQGRHRLRRRAREPHGLGGEEDVA